MGFFDAFGGDIISAGANLFGQQMANKANAKEASKQRDWQERMSNTEYQRRVKDLVAAGLSPMLAYGQGGAHAGQGASAAGSQQNVVDPAISSALAVKMNKAVVDKTEAEAAKQRAETQESVSRTANNALQGQMFLTDIQRTIADTDRLRNMFGANGAAYGAQMAQNRLRNQEYYQRERTNPIEVDRRTLDVKIRDLEKQILELDLPRNQANSAAWSTWYGQNIRPYIVNEVKNGIPSFLMPVNVRRYSKVGKAAEAASGGKKKAVTKGVKTMDDAPRYAPMPDSVRRELESMGMLRKR